MYCNKAGAQSEPSDGITVGALGQAGTHGADT